MGRNGKAEALFCQALGLKKTAIGEAHPYAILSLPSLAGCRAGLGRVDEARNMFESALAQADSLEEGAPIWTGRIRLRWAHGLLGAGLREEAKAEARIARDLLTEVLVPGAALVREADKLIEHSCSEN